MSLVMLNSVILDGLVGPVDNKPFNDKLHHFLKKIIIIIIIKCDI